MALVGVCGKYESVQQKVVDVKKRQYLLKAHISDLKTKQSSMFTIINENMLFIMLYNTKLHRFKTTLLKYF